MKHIKNISERSIIREVKTVIEEHKGLTLKEVAACVLDNNDWFCGLPNNPDDDLDDHNVKIVAGKIRAVLSSVKAAGEYLAFHKLSSVRGITLDMVKDSQRLLTFVKEETTSTLFDSKKIGKGLDNVSVLIDIAEAKTPEKTPEEVAALAKTFADAMA